MQAYLCSPTPLYVRTLLEIARDTEIRLHAIIHSQEEFLQFAHNRIET
jgi:hypothetical protein